MDRSTTDRAWDIGRGAAGGAVLLAAIGFMAELRRLTNVWYEKKFRDGPLWGVAHHDDDHPWEGFE